MCVCVCADTFPHFPVTQGALDRVIILYHDSVCTHACVCGYPLLPSVWPIIIYLPINCQSLCSLLTYLL